MRYLITYKKVEESKLVRAAFVSDWFEVENHWSSNVDMIVFDLVNLKFMDNGKDWKDIEEDHL